MAIAKLFALNANAISLEITGATSMGANINKKLL